MNPAARFTAMALSAAAAAITAGPAQAERRALPLTDPEQLVQLGYPADARNVFILEPAAGPAPARDPAPAGALGVVYTASAGFEFFPLADTVEYVKGPAFLVFNGSLITLTAGAFFETQLQPPPGATTLRWMDLLGFHDQASQILLATTIERCLPFLTGGNPTETVLGTSSIADQDGEFAVSQSISQALVTSSCTYHVRVRMGDTGGAAASALIQVAKARAEWGG